MAIRSVGVLGAGTMGAQIAAHAANAGVPAVLLDLTAETARQGLERAQTLKPDPFFTAGTVKLSVCIDMILTEIPFLERMERIKRLGYTAFEFWAWKPKDIEAILRKKTELGLEVATLMGSGWKHMNSEDARKDSSRAAQRHPAPR